MTDMLEVNKRIAYLKGVLAALDSMFVRKEIQQKASTAEYYRYRENVCCELNSLQVIAGNWERRYS